MSELGFTLGGLHDTLLRVVRHADHPLTTIEVHRERLRLQGHKPVLSGSGATNTALFYLSENGYIAQGTNESGAVIWSRNTESGAIPQVTPSYTDEQLLADLQRIELRLRQRADEDTLTIVRDATPSVMTDIGYPPRDHDKGDGPLVSYVLTILGYVNPIALADVQAMVHAGRDNT